MRGSEYPTSAENLSLCLLYRTDTCCSGWASERRRNDWIRGLGIAVGGEGGETQVGRSWARREGRLWATWGVEGILGQSIVWDSLLRLEESIHLFITYIIALDI